MAKRIGFRLVILLAVVLIFSGLVQAATPEFSGEMVLTDAEGQGDRGENLCQRNR